jgi:hypothetical protein
LPSANAAAASPDERGRVGHHANDARAGGQRRFQLCERHAGGDGNQQMIVCEMPALFGQRGGDLVGFGGQNQGRSRISKRRRWTRWFWRRFPW